MFLRILVLAAIAPASFACDRNGAHRAAPLAHSLQFQLDGMRHTGDAL
jgi:hypothetical protein